jgi:F-type H+-transporting ATPase subunit delta
MTNRKVARKYNIALYLTAVDRDSTEEVKKDIADIGKTIAGSKELQTFLTTPVVNPEKKAAVMKSMFEGKVNVLTLKFLDFLCEKQRINILPDITEDFLDLVNEKQGIVKAFVKTAVDISDSEKAALTARLKTYTGKDITATYTVDPSIKGGFIARIDDRIIDASIIRQLELLKERFSMGSFNN